MQLGYFKIISSAFKKGYKLAGDTKFINNLVMKEKHTPSVKFLKISPGKPTIKLKFINLSSKISMEFSLQIIGKHINLGFMTFKIHDLPL